MNLKSKEEITKYLQDCRESRRRNDGSYNALYMDLATGKVWRKFYASQNNWSVYDDPDIIRLDQTVNGMYMYPQKEDYIDTAEELLRIYEIVQDAEKANLIIEAKNSYTRKFAQETYRESYGEEMPEIWNA